MSDIRIKRSVTLLILVSFCLSVFWGCAVRHRTTLQEQASRKNLLVDHNMEQEGIISAADNAHWRQLGDQAKRDKRLSDPDLDWAIDTMQKPSKYPGILHSLMMGLFLEVQDFGPGQRQKIRKAVAPLLSSPDSLDQKYARAVLKKIS